MKNEPIKYKDTLAMPGSNLYRLLSEGKTKEAELQYRETEARHRKLLGDQDDNVRRNLQQADRKSSPS